MIQWYLSTWRIAPFWRFWRLDTRLDTPPSINRRHPDSRLAQGAAILAACTSRSLVPGLTAQRKASNANASREKLWFARARNGNYLMMSPTCCRYWRQRAVLLARTAACERRSGCVRYRHRTYRAINSRIRASRLACEVPPNTTATMCFR